MSVSLEPLPPLEDRPIVRRPWYLNPYLHVALSVLLNSAAQPLLKHGADNRAIHAVLGISGLLSGWVWLGIACMISSLLSWLYAMRFVPLNIAFSLGGIAYIIVPLLSWGFLHDHISLQRWLGIALVTIGVLVTAREAVRLEEKL